MENIGYTLTVCSKFSLALVTLDYTSAKTLVCLIYDDHMSIYLKNKKTKHWIF